MLTPFSNTAGNNIQFLTLWIWFLMFVFIVEMAARMANRLNEKGRKVLTVIYITTGSCLVAYMAWLGWRTLQAELETWERTWPWLAGGIIAVVTTWAIHKGSKNNKITS